MTLRPVLREPVRSRPYACPHARPLARTLALAWQSRDAASASAPVTISFILTGEPTVTHISLEATRADDYPRDWTLQVRRGSTSPAIDAAAGSAHHTGSDRLSRDTTCYRSPITAIPPATIAPWYRSAWRLSREGCRREVAAKSPRSSATFGLAMQASSPRALPPRRLRSSCSAWCHAPLVPRC